MKGDNGERRGTVDERNGIVRMADPSGAPLHVRMLGHPEIFWNGLALDVSRRQTRALLYRLAVRLAPIPRSELFYLFWPDRPEAVAHRDLTHLLTHLRRAFPQPDVLLADGDFVALNPRSAWVDTLALELALAPAPSAYRLEALRAAVPLYRGPFLADFSLTREPEVEDWIAEEQPVWERRYLEALQALMALEAEVGHIDAAIALGERYLATDNLAEPIHRHLITLYGMKGERALARRQFERCAAALWRDLSLAPLPETVAAYHAAVLDIGVKT